MSCAVNSLQSREEEYKCELISVQALSLIILKGVSYAVNSPQSGEGGFCKSGSEMCEFQDGRGDFVRVSKECVSLKMVMIVEVYRLANAK